MARLPIFNPWGGPQLKVAPKNMGHRCTHLLGMLIAASKNIIGFGLSIKLDFIATAPNSKN
jgi:hypothetical protein